MVFYGVFLDCVVFIVSVFVFVDLRGVDFYGVNWLFGYIVRIVVGVVDFNLEINVIEKIFVMVLIDVWNIFGFVVGIMVVDKGIEMVEIYGMGMVVVCYSNYYGMGVIYVLWVVWWGFVCFVYMNVSCVMFLWGGVEVLFGISFFVVGVFGGEEGDFVLDMLFSVVVWGKICKVLCCGEIILGDYVFDKEGCFIIDLVVVLDGGVVLLMGGLKGSGLVMMMDIFGGVMSGLVFVGGVND